MGKKLKKLTTVAAMFAMVLVTPLGHIYIRVCTGAAGGIAPRRQEEEDERHREPFEF